METTLALALHTPLGPALERLYRKKRRDFFSIPLPPVMNFLFDPRSKKPYTPFL
jgi:hypothetical protein